MKDCTIEPVLATSEVGESYTNPMEVVPVFPWVEAVNEEVAPIVLATAATSKLA
jgi:hypothetical protein